MARVSLIDEERHPELAPLVARVKGSRGRILNVYRLLLHSPDLAAPWLELMSAVRWSTQLEGLLRELVIVRVALLNGADYVVRDHAGSHAPREGVTPEQLEALRDWRGSALFGGRERAALAYADAMTQTVAVPEAVFDEMREHFSERQIVDLSVLVAAYNMHTRVLCALQVDPEETHR